MKKFLVALSFLIVHHSGAQLDTAAMTGEAEAILLHIDQQQKISGEVLWFKLYMVNTPYRPAALSSIAYVELLNPVGVVLTRLKLKCSKGVSNGQIIIPKELLSGSYRLRAYTLWMKSNNMAGSFTGNLTIRNYRDLNLLPDSILVHKGKSNDSDNLLITSGQNIYKPREAVSIKLEPVFTKQQSRWMNISVSIHQKYLDSNEAMFQFSNPGNAATETIPSKEILVYPTHSNSLEGFGFDTTSINSQTFNVAPESTGNVVNEELLVQKKIIEHYPVSNSLGEFPEITPPFDITYRIEEYQALLSLEEFIKEIVPHVRIFKSGKKSLRIRNSESDQNMYFFKKPPLMLVNGHIVDSLELVMSIPLENIYSLNLSWKAATINRSLIFGLADNGILSIQTKHVTPFEARYPKLYGKFHFAADFNGRNYPVNEFDETIPDFRDLLYWVPDLTLANKSIELSFFTSDKTGDYVIEVKGLTDTGEFVSAYREFQVIPAQGVSK